MKVASAPVYPELPASVEILTAQTFRLQKIGELEAFLRAEIEQRGCLHKKYRRAVNTLDSTCAVLGVSCAATAAVGAGLLASGVGFVPGLALEAVTVVAGLLDVAGVVVSRRCSRKVAKHEAVRILASSKLNTVHSHISKALEDCKISDDEYKLVFQEVEKYRAMKEKLRTRTSKHTAGSLIDEKTKNDLIKLWSEQARASFIKKLVQSADSESHSS